ncbi:MAG: hypothetical protein Q9225_006286 [Loekoesia sp. 1 TL-2023]
MALARSVILLLPFLVGLISVLFAAIGYVPEFLFHTRFYTYTPVVHDRKHGIFYRGYYANGVDHFQNIFYAEDTSGPNRFAPPVAIQHPPGGNALGSAADQMFHPDGLIWQAQSNGQPIVYVGINYRLGIYGYATSKALIAKKHTNNGLRDQRTAFEWIRDNIEAFGGDPENVTAIGQSVGASSIGLHLTSYRGKKGVPFQKAIMMSGASGLNFNIMSPLIASNTAKVAKSLNCITPQNPSPGSEETLTCLKNTPMETLNKVAISYPEDAKPRIGGPSFYPTYDGDYISERPSVSLRKGHFVKGPLCSLFSPLWGTPTHASTQTSPFSFPGLQTTAPGSHPLISPTPTLPSKPSNAIS